jgi:hypothetical protein
VRGSFSFRLLGLGFGSFFSFGAGGETLTRLPASLGLEGRQGKKARPAVEDCGWGDKAEREPPARVEDGRWVGGRGY